MYCVERDENDNCNLKGQTFCVYGTWLDKDERWAILNDLQ